MINGREKILDSKLKKAFDSGFSNAASSFSILAKDAVQYNNLQRGFYPITDFSEAEKFSFIRNGKNYLITTEIFGEVTGKSYLLLNETEYHGLTSHLPSAAHAKFNLKEEFIKELDNILSAAVISKLSNEMGLKMFGDVPLLVGETTGRIEDIIYDDYGDQMELLYLNASFFSFEHKSELSPFFIWVIDSQSIHIPEHKLAIG